VARAAIVFDAVPVHVGVAGGTAVESKGRVAPAHRSVVWHDVQAGPSVRR
jgi:hypothetical protein